FGRLTGKPGVCLATLGPGATNLVTGVADAFLDHAPLVAITGQTNLATIHKEAHQYIDTPELFRSITKWQARVMEPEVLPEVVRKAFKIAETAKPGPTHIELPEDVAARPIAETRPLTVTPVEYPPPADHAIQPAAELNRGAEHPTALARQPFLRGRASRDRPPAPA